MFFEQNIPKPGQQVDNIQFWSMIFVHFHVHGPRVPVSQTTMKPNNPTARMAPKVIIDMKDPPEKTPTKITVPQTKKRGKDMFSH